MKIVLSAVMLVNTGITAFASDYGSTYVSDENETLLVVEDGLFVNGHFYTRAEFETQDTIGRAASEKIRAGSGYTSYVKDMLNKPNIRKMVKQIMEERTRKTIAEANEVMEYFTSVMRGEVKDQFGLDAPLTERTNAAKELAKRTVDVDLRKEGLADNQITVTLTGWGDENE